MEDVHHKWISPSPTKLQSNLFEYGHFSNTDTSILWTVSNVPTKQVNSNPDQVNLHMVNPI